MPQPFPTSRASPSPRYAALCRAYAQLHREADAGGAGAWGRGFPGTSLLSHVERIRRAIEASGARTILDYGAGKGHQYRPFPVIVDGVHVADSIAEYWDVDEVRCYDPGCAAHAALPPGQFDGVVCTDVLEHCPEEDLPWILDEILGFARRFAYLNVACTPARKTLPSGENAHATVRPPEWWLERVSARAASRPGLWWELQAVAELDGAAREHRWRNGAPVNDDVPQASPLPAAAVALEAGGCRIRLLAPDASARDALVARISGQPGVLEWVATMPQGTYFLDAGAGVGFVTLLAALARKARVLAIEPDERLAQLLTLNIDAAGVGALAAGACAQLSDQPGIHSLSVHTHGAGTSLGVLAHRFDDFVARGRFDAPAYIRLCMPGEEHRALAGMRETLADPRVHSVLVETQPAITDMAEVARILDGAGLRRSGALAAASTGIAVFRREASS